MVLALCHCGNKITEEEVNTKDFRFSCDDCEVEIEFIPNRSEEDLTKLSS